MRRFLLSLRPIQMSGTPVANNNNDVGSGTGALMATTWFTIRKGMAVRPSLAKLWGPLKKAYVMLSLLGAPIAHEPRSLLGVVALCVFEAATPVPGI